MFGGSCFYLTKSNLFYQNDMCPLESQTQLRYEYVLCYQVVMRNCPLKLERGYLIDPLKALCLHFSYLLCCLTFVH